MHYPTMRPLPSAASRPSDMRAPTAAQCRPVRSFTDRRMSQCRLLLACWLQTVYKTIQSPLKYQTRCVAAFPDKSGFLVTIRLPLGPTPPCAGRLPVRATPRRKLPLRVRACVRACVRAASLPTRYLPLAVDSPPCAVLCARAAAQTALSCVFAAAAAGRSLAAHFDGLAGRVD